MEVPVVLVTYNRPRHTRKVLKALRKNQVSPLYIFADGTKPNEKDRMRVEAVRTLFKNIDWTEPIITGSTVNRGLRKSIVGAVDQVLTDHEVMILLEDDCVPGPYFFKFMHKCLNKYKDNKKVLGVTGYTVPLGTATRGYPWDVYFFPRIGSWGWGTWRRAWKLYERDFKAAYEKAKRKNIDLRQGGNDFPAILQATIKGRLDAWTPGWVMAAYLNRMVFAYPTVSHVQNIGWDGSGRHCAKSTMYDTPLCQVKPKRFPSGVVQYPPIEQTVKRYYP